MSNKNLISVSELLRLMHEIRDKRPDICIRFRLLGEMWGVNFLRVENVQGNKALLKDENDGRLIVIHDLPAVMQFEIDNSFMGFHAHYHYEVTPTPEVQQSVY